MRGGGGRWPGPSFAMHSGARQSPVPGNGPAIAWLRTLLAKGPGALQRQHLRYQPLRRAQPQLHCIVLDTSGSMRQGGRLALAKGFAARLIEQAARAGDHVALLCFGGQGVELLLPPGPARTAGAARVRRCGGGGGTPLAQALAVAQGLLRTSTHPALWLLTDGRTLEQPAAPTSPTVVVDFEDPRRALGRCAVWAERWGADYRLASAFV